MQDKHNRSPIRIPGFDAVLASIAQASSPDALLGVQKTVETYFVGTQREHLEAAIAARQAALA